jgi:hypothetical protein
LHSSLDVQVKEDDMGLACSTFEDENADKILVGNTETARKTWCRRVNIKMGARELGWEGVGWVHLAQDRNHMYAVVSAAMILPLS